MRFRLLLPFLALCLLIGSSTRLPAQAFRRGGTEFNAKRPVSLPTDKTYSVVVVQFFHHGQIDAQGTNIAICHGRGTLTPSRILQLGPGDYCRAAFQTVEGETEYEIFYGGAPPDEEEVPEWASNVGLILQTRKYQDCNLNSLEAVRQAFDSAEPFGSDYVDAVGHSHNPFSLKAGPFLSRYQGTLHIGSAGTYGFLTSSQDCSFLLIDGKEVVSAPGRHRPLYRATRGTRQDVPLAAGPHRFDYYHAASGPEAMMVAAWEIAPTDEKPQPVAIPSEAFLAERIGRVQPGLVTMLKEKMVPDFLIGITGDVPLPDNDEALVSVQFADRSPAGLRQSSKLSWDFGDGQSSDQPDPTHVYLRPGLYKVTLLLKRLSRESRMTNTIYIDRPPIMRNAKKETLHELDQYLPTIETYDPARLDAPSLWQLLSAYRHKADLLLAGPEPVDGETTDAESGEDPPEPTEADIAARKVEAKAYLRKAVDAAATALNAEDSPATDSESLLRIIRMVGPIARNELAESLDAARLYHATARRIQGDESRAECEIEAADIAVNDLLNVKAAKLMLDSATARLGRQGAGVSASRIERVWGDYHAATGAGAEAREAYLKARRLVATRRTHTEQSAWRGAHSRSAEQFIKSEEFDRAAVQLRAWAEEFPDAMIQGYLPLMQARYWTGRHEYAHVAATCERLLTVNPQSPYIDQILLLTAQCDIKREKPERAAAILHSLLKDYPGSPLVPDAREMLEQVENAP